MFRTLRRRFVLGLVLPVVLITSFIGIALIYALETRAVWADLSEGLTRQAMLVAELASERAGIWRDPALAQAFMTRVSPRLSAHTMLLDASGQLLGRSDSEDTDSLDQPLDHAGLARILAGDVRVQVENNQSLGAEVIDVLVPVVGTDQRVIGVVRLTRRMAGIDERSLRLRYAIAVVLLTGLLLGSALSWVLALDLERPLRRVNQAISDLASSRRLTPLPEQGPEEIRQLSRAINALVARLRTMEETRRHFVANLVHELGRPLGALHSAIQALQGGADEQSDLRQELLTGMEAVLGNLHRLLDDLSRLHEQIVGTTELDRRLVALSEWLPPTLAPWREAALDEQLHWETTVPVDLPTLMCDSDRLAQALGNLLSNAIKYTTAGGTVSVGAGMGEGEIWIQVSDTGSGIALQDQAKIFTPFHRGPQDSRFPQGMGLGLSIARQLIVAHGGRLEVESALGQGSRFTIWLPLHSLE